MQTPEKILVFQTAFIGDVVLTLPLVQVLHEYLPAARIDFVAVPAGASLLAHHPAIHEVIPYDKKGKDSGLAGVFGLSRVLRARGYDAALVPHRSLRSAAIVWLSRIPCRIGFDRSAGRFLLTEIVAYDKNVHEVHRDLALMKGLGIEPPEHVLPSLYPGDEDRRVVDALIGSAFTVQKGLIGIAPGSVWNTKRWPKESFIALIQILIGEGFAIAMIGGQGDEQLCSEIQQAAGESTVLNAAGKLTLLQSAELIRRCVLLVSNDSAPMHLAVSVRTPVVAIFGPTVPAFGFAPIGIHDQIVGHEGLSCRPCTMHGSRECPIKTFECMKLIIPRQVHSSIKAVLAERKDHIEQGTRNR